MLYLYVLFCVNTLKAAKEEFVIYKHYMGVKSEIRRISLKSDGYKGIIEQMENLLAFHDNLFIIKNFSLMGEKYHNAYDTIYEVNYNKDIRFQRFAHIEVSSENKFLIDSEGRDVYLGMDRGGFYEYLQLNVPCQIKENFLESIKILLYDNINPTNFKERIQGKSNNRCIVRWWKNDSIIHVREVDEKFISEQFNDLSKNLYITTFKENLYYPHEKEWQYSPKIHSKYKKNGCMEIYFKKGYSNLGIQGLLFPTDDNISIYGIYEDNAIGKIHLYYETREQKEKIRTFQDAISKNGKKLPVNYSWAYKNYIRIDDGNYICTEIPEGFVIPGTFRSWEDLIFPDDSLETTYIYDIKNGYIQSCKRTIGKEFIFSLNNFLGKTSCYTISNIDIKNKLKELAKDNYKLIFFPYGIKIDSTFISFGMLIDDEYRYIIPFDYKGRKYHNKIYHIQQNRKIWWKKFVSYILKDTEPSSQIPHPQKNKLIPFIHVKELNEYKEVDRIWRKQNITPMPIPEKIENPIIRVQRIINGIEYK